MTDQDTLLRSRKMEDGSHIVGHEIGRLPVCPRLKQSYVHAVSSDMR